MPWAQTGSYTKPPGWRITVQRILKRDNRVCYVCGHGAADTVDHVTPRARGGSDNDDNLRAIHRYPCHQTKSLRESHEARWAVKAARPPEAHPGTAAARRGTGGR